MISVNPNDDIPLNSGSQMQWRPGSSTSNYEWGSDVFDHGPEIPTISAGIDVDNEPVSISRDVLADMNPENDEVEEAKTDGICYRITKKLRGFWGTRQTEDTKNDRELYIRTTIRELVVYILFLITLCILTFGMTSSTHYYYTKVMQELFIDSEFQDTGNTFRDITTMQDFWRFVEGPLLEGLFWERHYNNRSLTGDELGYIYYENKVLGVARIRQLKVRNGSCDVHPDFRDEITSCYDSYSPANEDTQPFGPEEETAWQYHTEEELDGSTHWGLLDYKYEGGGYYQDLSTSKNKSVASIQYLKQNLWLDRGTRVAFIDFTVYNANINLFCVIRLVVEFPATGGAVSSWQFLTVKLLRYVTPYDYFLLGCEILYLAFIFYYIIEEILEIKMLRCAYFLGVWNCLDILVILLSLIALAFNVYRTIAVSNLLEGLLENPNTYPDFEFLGYWQVQYNNMVAVVVFFAWIKIFKYISFNRTMTQLQSTLSRCSKDIAGFAIMFFIIFFAYAQLGYLVFGTQVKDFSTFGESIFTQFRIILGDFDFHSLESANRILGPIFFLTYVFFVFFVLLNMFLAIINDTYSEVKAEISAQKSEFEITDFIKKGYNKILEKLALKKDHIKDIQDAINQADLNHDRDLDFEEWRLDLKRRGIPDSEITAIFSKYDRDGDMILNNEEQRRLQADLEKQRTNLNVELEEIERKKVEPLERPMTAKSHFSYGTMAESEGISDFSEDEYAGREKRIPRRNYVNKEDHQALASRVDRMEQSIGAVVSKIDSVIVKLEAMELAKLKRRESSGKLPENINDENQSGRSSQMTNQQLEMKVQNELNTWASAVSLRLTKSSSNTPTSSRPSSSWNPRVRPMSEQAFQNVENRFDLPKSSSRLRSAASVGGESFRPKSREETQQKFLPKQEEEISRPNSADRILQKTPEVPIINNLNVPEDEEEEDGNDVLGL